MKTNKYNLTLRQFTSSTPEAILKCYLHLRLGHMQHELEDAQAFKRLISWHNWLIIVLNRMNESVCIQHIHLLSGHQVLMAVVIWAKGQGRDRKGQTKEITV